MLTVEFKECCGECEGIDLSVETLQNKHFMTDHKEIVIKCRNSPYCEKYKGEEVIAGEEQQ